MDKENYNKNECIKYDELIDKAQSEIDAFHKDIDIILKELYNLDENLNNMKSKFDELKFAENNEEFEEIFTQISKYGIGTIVNDSSIKKHFEFFEKHFSIFFEIEYAFMKK